MIGKIRNFLVEVKVELSKVSWSTRQEVIAATIVVLVATLLLAIYIGIIDVALAKTMQILIR